MAKELQVAKYESLSGIQVELDAKTVRDYLARGNGEISDQEVAFFIRTCQAKKLDPLENGEIYLVKYDNTKPAQIVIGYHAYLRRAERFPEYRGYKAGVVVIRDGKLEYKEGAAVYKQIGEELVGGWCRVLREMPNGNDEETYAEVSLEEYSTGKSNWAAKPATMIRKVAISQAIRGAFPNEYEGLYTVEEMSNTIPADVVIENEHVQEPVKVDPLTTTDQRQAFMQAIDNSFSDKDLKNVAFKTIMDTLGLKSTKDMKESQLAIAYEMIDTFAKQDNEQETAPEEK